MPKTARARATGPAQKTMSKFLDGAEAVFGLHGYEGTTIRAISTKAGVNLGTFQHYWGSKRELFRNVFERRFKPLHEQLLRDFRAIESEAATTGVVRSSQVLRTMIRTALPANEDDCEFLAQDMKGTAGRKRFQALFGRALLDPSPIVAAEMNRIFDPSMVLFMELMRRACPQLRRAELDWRVICIMGSLAFAQTFTPRRGKWLGPESETDDAVAGEWVLHFLSRGIDAPPF